MTLPATDSFVSASDQALQTYSANWTINSGSVIVLGATDDVRGNTANGENLCHWNADTPNNNQYAQVTMVQPAQNDNDSGPACRVAASAETAYMATLTSNGDVSAIYKVVAGAFTKLGNNAVAVSAGDVMRIEANGTSIQLKRNGSVFVGPFTDSAIASGFGGMWLYSTTSARLDNFEVGNIGSGSASSGTLAVTLGNVTSSAAGALAISATESTTLAAVTLSAAAKLAIAATESVTLANVTLSAAAQLAIQGTQATTLAAVTLAAAATLPIQATEATTLGNVTLSAAATLPITANEATTLGAVTLAASAGNVIQGNAAISLAAVTLAANGTLAGAAGGTLAVTLASVSLAAAAQLAIQAQASIGLGAVTLHATESPLVIEIVEGVVYGPNGSAILYGPNRDAIIYSAALVAELQGA